MYVQQIQDNPLLLNDLTPADADDLYYAIVRQHGAGTFKDKHTYDGKGNYGPLADLLKGTTLVNTAKIAQLSARGEYLFRMWAETLEPRGANHRNQCVGNELATLVKIADANYASEEEYERYLKVFAKERSNIRLAPCNGFAKGRCNRDAYCCFMHVTER